MKMKTILALAILSAPVPALAQDFTFTLNEGELNVIVIALQKRPFEDVAAVLNKLTAQYQAQTAKPPEETGKDKPAAGSEKPADPKADDKTPEKPEDPKN